jgi:hypothetical protein
MMDSINTPQNSYRVEVSGWDASENFFVEKAVLEWHGGEQKEISLQASPREGCILFVRLLQTTPSINNIPIAYQAATVAKKDEQGRTRVCLKQLKSRKDKQAARLVDAPRMTA